MFRLFILLAAGYTGWWLRDDVNREAAKAAIKEAFAGKEKKEGEVIKADFTKKEKPE